MKRKVLIILAPAPAHIPRGDEQLTCSGVTSVGDWIGELARRFDPRWAADWDAVGLVTGSPEAPADRALFAVDPVEATVDEAVRRGCGLLVTHHPLLLRGVHGVPVTTPKGRLVDRLIRADVALYVAHTNADVALPGVSDALAAALGLTEVAPLAPGEPDGALKLVVFVPADVAERVIDALAAAGAGTIGEYDRCAWSTPGTGTFEARGSARPAVGSPGARTEVPEVRVELVLPRRRLAEAVSALRAAHPYEEPAYDVYPALLPHGRGLGRIGSLPAAVPLRSFVAAVRAALPSTAAGLRAAGDPDRPVRRVAVCGGAGDSLIGAAQAAGADVYVTADLRHHVTSEAVADGLALVDATHWATEWPWLAAAAEAVTSSLAAGGHTVAADVSEIVTDPWSLSL